MTLLNVSNGAPWFFPPTLFSGGTPLNISGTIGGYSSVIQAATIDAVGEKAAHMGHMHWFGNPTSAKTVGTSSIISFFTNNVTYANASSVVRVGIQDVATAAGPPAQPDGTWDVYKDCTTATGEMSSASDFVQVNVTMNTGSKSIAQGDLIAVVFDMTGRGGSDSVTIQHILGAQGYVTRPVVNTYVGAAWGNLGNSLTPYPNVLIQADDGTLGIIKGGYFIKYNGVYQWVSTSTPDEYGLIFQVPFRCAVDSFVAAIGGSAAGADYIMRLYSSPLGSPAVLASVQVDGAQMGGNSDDRYAVFGISTPVILNPNTDYCLAVEPNGINQIDLGYITLGNANHRPVLGLANCRGASRNNAGGGASPVFSGETTTTIPGLGVGISHLDMGNPNPTYAIGGLP